MRGIMDCSLAKPIENHDAEFTQRPFVNGFFVQDLLAHTERTLRCIHHRSAMRRRRVTQPDRTLQLKISRMGSHVCTMQVRQKHCAINKRVIAQEGPKFPSS